MNPPAESNPLLQAALDYAARGGAVFPCRPGGKEPLTEHGFHEATTDTQRIAAWWQRWPDANLALDCQASGLVVADVDGDQGAETWAALKQEHGFSDETVQATTPGGGMHYYFAAPPGLTIPSSVGKVGPGVDIRAAGGYVVAPPSRLETGRVWAWEVQHGL